MRLFLQFPKKSVERIESFPFLFKEVSFKRNEIIYKSNDDKADKFYFVYRGGVEMIKQVTEHDTLNFSNRLEKQMKNKVRKYTQTKDLCVLTINPGDFFGHEDIFDQNKRNLTAQSSSSETILFEIELQLLNELDSPLILQNIKQLGEQRKSRCLEKLQEIQSFKQDNLRQKPSQKQLPQDMQRIIKEQIAQKSLNYQLKIEQDKRISLENQEHSQVKDLQLTLEIDPSKNKRMILGDDIDYQRAKQKIQKKLEGQLGKQDQVETYYQKILRPKQINNFESCLNYIQTVPSFSKLKSNQYLPSLKESIHIFEEEKLTKKIENLQMIRKTSIEEHNQPKYLRIRCNSSNIIPSCQNAEEEQFGQTPTSQDLPQISSFQAKSKNGEINYKVLTPLHIKSSYQLNLEAELIDQSKKKTGFIDYQTPKSLFSNQNLSPKLSLQEEPQEKLLVCSSFNFQTKKVQEQNDSYLHASQSLAVRQRQSSLYIMNQQVQKVRKNRLIDRQMFNKDSEDDIFKTQQRRKEQIIFQNSKIRAQSLHENKQSSIELEKQPSISRESNSFRFKELSSNRQQPFQHNFYQSGCFSSQQIQTQNQKSEFQSQQIDCKNSKEEKPDLNKQHLLSMLKIKIDNNNNQTESNPLIIKQFNLPGNCTNQNKLIKSHLTDKRSVSENLIQKKLDQLHALLLPLSKKSNIKIISKASQKKNKNQLQQEQINMGTSTQDIFKYNSPIILNPIYNVQTGTAKNSNNIYNNNANKKFFAEDSFTIQSYKSLNSNKEIKAKVIKLSEADERVLQISAQLRTASSSQSIENYLEPKIKNHKLVSFQKASDSIKRFIISPQRTSIENQKLNKKFTFKIANQEEEEINQTNKKYVQSLIFPDLKFPVYKSQS
ncbi:hypothetical protein ABPG72_010877 [Tetrahymena utriculariae]